GSGAIWSLRSNALRPAGWTSADAAGLPIFPGLARYDEVARGVIDHALRFTAARTRRAYVYPARHYASSSDDPALPPMGLRVRVRAGVDISGFPHQARIVLQALKTYGMILADNGPRWHFSGAPPSHRRAAAGRRRGGAEVDAAQRRPVRHARRQRAAVELAQVHGAAVELAADEVAVVRLELARPERAARENEVAEAWRVALDLGLDRVGE